MIVNNSEQIENGLGMFKFMLLVVMMLKQFWSWFMANDGQNQCMVVRPILNSHKVGDVLIFFWQS